MRIIRDIIVHCSATEASRNFKARDIESWHRARGFKRIGYHYIIDRDGAIEREGRKPSAGQDAQRP